MKWQYILWRQTMLSWNTFKISPLTCLYWQKRDNVILYILWKSHDYTSHMVVMWHLSPHPHLCKISAMPVNPAALPSSLLTAASPSDGDSAPPPSSQQSCRFRSQTTFTRVSLQALTYKRYKVQLYKGKRAPQLYTLICCNSLSFLDLKSQW